MKPRKVVIAIDSFKGCLSSEEANRAAAEGLRSVCPEAEIVEVPVSDGGEGFLEAFHAAIGGEMVEAEVKDPLMRDIRARYLLKGKTAVVEVAETIGLALLDPEERNPLATTSYGVGQLVADAFRRGARHIIVGLGGSATSDAGRGMLQALSDALGPARHGGHEVPRGVHTGGPETLSESPYGPPEALGGARFTIATDVEAPLYGENGAAFVFGPQKGATQGMVRLLDERAREFSAASAKRFGYDRSKMKGAGAAGGLGYAFLQYLDAECLPGTELLLKTIDFDALVADADLVITGEGAADSQTLLGKLPMGILQHAAGVPVFLIAGKVDDRPELLRAGFSCVECINPPGIALEEAMKKAVAQGNIGSTVRRLLTVSSHCKTNTIVHL